MSKSDMKELLKKNPKQDDVMEKYDGLVRDINEELSDADKILSEYSKVKKQVDKIIKDGTLKEKN